MANNAANKNLLIANGRELIGQLDWPGGGGAKWHPYSLQDSRAVLHPQLQTLSAIATSIPDYLAPRSEITACLDLHPAYLAKSYFPAGVLRDAGIGVLGSRAAIIVPRKVKRGEPAQEETASIFVSGTAHDFTALDGFLMRDDVEATKHEQLRRVENARPHFVQDRMRIRPNSKWPDFFHATLHADQADKDILDAFREAVRRYNGKISDRGYRFVPGLAFLAFEMPSDNLAQLAQFSRLRVIRSVPELRTDWEGAGEISRAVKPVAIAVPDVPAINDRLRVAVFDGGIGNSFPGYARELAAPGLQPSSPAEQLHGQHVTSALLFGALDRKKPALERPYCNVDHVRVLPTEQTPDQALDVLDRIIGQLQAARAAGSPYRFANISLGPVATFFDDDVHEWTSRLDVEFSDGAALCTVAVGNNGELPDDLRRIQPPGDSVNVFAIGSANSQGKRWNRAPYSACGPGRSPGYVKPDVLVFGGSAEEPLAVYSPAAAQLVGVGGTSYASPLCLRTAIGVDVLSAGAFSSIALQALAINSAEFSTRSHDRGEVGWGRVPLLPDDLLYTPADVVRVVYQGQTRPGFPQKAVIPIPAGLPATLRLKIGATFCYRAPIDPSHSVNYTKAGLWVRCYKAPKNSLNIFGQGMYKSEAKLRRDSQRWDAVLHSSGSAEAGELTDPYFHINYQVRDESEAVRPQDANPMPYALVVTIQAPGVDDLLARVQAAYPVLNTVELQTQVRI
ncbi:hypothetical protein D0B54_09705 [Solimonas sp. K1W22B-7]|uniref:S8 family peptidase n=1 Tax=Solimonas sp. K1W22B-7 TaxID=2303331 RepID=UPI000E32E1C0|nr:S8 family peptidase [Solimonas sp. K1W22B-7]AXQ28944.1 hypothetical protein D0B54_09705 [Solimonas sp. K1W22B-7]